MRFKSLSIVVFTLLLMLVPLYMMTAPAAAESPTNEGADPDGAGTLRLLHNNDGESSLLPLQYTVITDTGYPNTMTVELDIGGVAAYKTLVDQNIAEAHDAGSAVINVYAGDAFLASATLACSLNNPDIDPYDSVAQRQIAYDAHIFGNHEFDYSPDFLERFIRGFDDGSGLTQPFLSSNLDFSMEAGFDDLVDMDEVLDGPVTDDRVVAHSAIITDSMTGQRFAIVGITTPMLPTISSPRDVMVTSTTLTETAAVVQDEINRIENDYGVQKIIFVSHLQDLDNDKQLIGQLSGVDVAVGGGGDELLVNSEVPTMTQLLPGEGAPIDGEYPLEVTDADGQTVYVVTTAGNYKYMGRIDVTFDANGEVTGFNAETSYPRRVIPDSDIATSLDLTDTVMMNTGIVDTVSTPVEACLDDLANTPIARSEILLDVSRNASRGGESNAGNMIADSFIYAYEQYSATSGLRAGNMPLIALQNGGGIRQNAGDILPTGGAPGTISQLDTINVLPFDNFLTVVNDVTPQELKEVLEQAAAGLPGAAGSFLQMSGLHVTYNSSMEVGSRVMSATLTNGTMMIEAGTVMTDAPTIMVVTNSFVASGGDGYSMLADNTQSRLFDNDGNAVAYEQPWREYMQSFATAGDPALPTIPADDPRYQPGGEGRITIEAGVTAVEMANLDANRSTAPLMPLALGMMVMIGFGFVAIWQRRSR